MNTAVQLDIAGFSEQGPRPDNQDAVEIDQFSDKGVLIVADGMGGHKGGRLAAETTIREVLGAAPIQNQAEARRALERADSAVRERGEKDPQLAGMGAAAGLLSRVRSRDGAIGWVAANVGDVRIVSRSPDGTTRLETRDHTPAFAEWEEGRIGLDEIPEAKGANRLHRSIGHGGVADAGWIPLAPGWRYAIVSDGVTKAMRLDEIGSALSAATAEQACRAMREKVEARGPDDNYSGVAVIVPHAGEAADHTHDPEATMVPETPPPSAGHALPARDAMPPRSGALWIVLLIAFAAGLLSAWALWEARDGRMAQERLRTEIEALRADVETLRQEVREDDLFAPEASPGGTAEPGGEP